MADTPVTNWSNILRYVERGQRRQASLASRDVRDSACVSTNTEFRQLLPSNGRCGHFLRQRENCCVSANMAFLTSISKLFHNRKPGRAVTLARKVYNWLLHAAPHVQIDNVIDIDLLHHDDRKLFALARVMKSKMHMTLRIGTRSFNLPNTRGLRGLLVLQRQVGELNASVNIHSLLPCSQSGERLSIRVELPTAGNDRVVTNNVLGDADTLETVCLLIHSHVGRIPRFNFHIALPLPLSPVVVTKTQVKTELIRSYNWQYRRDRGLYSISRSRQLIEGGIINGVEILYVTPLNVPSVPP